MRFFWRYKLDHITFWIITIAFYAYVTTSLLKKAGAYQYWLNIFVRNGLLILICYINIYYLFPNFFKKNKYVLYSLLVFGCLLLYTALENMHNRWLYGYVLGDINKQSFFSNTFYNFSIAVFYMGFTIALMLSKNWYKQHLLLQKIQVENLETELRYLKAQINPHFLFNSLNTIYFQIDKNNTEARTSLHKFSELLRYQLYECNEEQIAIEKEIEYLKSYIDFSDCANKKIIISVLKRMIMLAAFPLHLYCLFLLLKMHLNMFRVIQIKAMTYMLDCAARIIIYCLML